MGERADAIAQECPGLFEVEGKGKGRKAKANSAREHPKLLEKVQPNSDMHAGPSPSPSSPCSLHASIQPLGWMCPVLIFDMCTQVRRMCGEQFWEDHVRLQKRKDHFLWTIESTGMDTEIVRHSLHGQR